MVAAAMSWAATAAAVAQQPERTKEQTDLDTVAAIFLPGPQLESFLSEACRTTYGTKLANTPELVDAEQQMPGLRKRMLDASYNYCHANAPALTERARKHIEEDWQKRATPQQIALIASVFRQAVQAVPTINLKRGETAVQGVRRQDAKFESADAALDSALTRLSHLPGGAPLAQKVIAYSRIAEAERPLWMQPAMDLVREALHQAHLAANAYAQERGFEPLYR
jgi:cytochrome c5